MNEIRDIFNFAPRGLIEIVIVVGCTLLFIYYHVKLVKRLKTQPETFIMGRQYLVRNAWAKLAKEGRELVIVQTMRNMIMSASFLASTAILLMGGFLGAAFTTDKFSQFTYSLNFLGIESQSLWMFKVLIIAVIYFVSFFCFTIAIRSFIHICLMGNLYGNEEFKNYDADFSQEVNRSAIYYTLGMRGFYISIPFIVWLFGPFWMLLGSILLLIVLKRVD